MITIGNDVNRTRTNCYIKNKYRLDKYALPRDQLNENIGATRILCKGLTTLVAIDFKLIKNW